MSVKLNNDNAYVPFNITWDDLTEDAQKRLLDALGIESPKQAAFHTHAVHVLNVGWMNEGLLERVMALDINSWLISKDSFHYYAEDETSEYWSFSDEVTFPFSLESNNDVPDLLKEHGVIDGLRCSMDPESSCFYIYIHREKDIEIFVDRYNALVRKFWKYEYEEKK